MSSIATPAQLAAARSLLQLTQREVAGETGVSLSTLGKYEKGRTGIRANLLAKLQDFYTSRGILFVNRSLEGVYLERGPETGDARVEIRFKI